jgi:hypothetical protein
MASLKMLFQLINDELAQLIQLWQVIIEQEVTNKSMTP